MLRFIINFIIMYISVQTPFDLKKQKYNIWEFLDEILEKYENIEDMFFVKMMKEWEQTKDVNLKKFYNIIDSKINESNY